MCAFGVTIAGNAREGKRVTRQRQRQKGPKEETDKPFYRKGDDVS
jgi:hypothetical protein